MLLTIPPRVALGTSRTVRRKGLPPGWACQAAGLAFVIRVSSARTRRAIRLRGAVRKLVCRAIGAFCLTLLSAKLAWDAWQAKWLPLCTLKTALCTPLAIHGLGFVRIRPLLTLLAFFFLRIFLALSRQAHVADSHASQVLNPTGRAHLTRRVLPALVHVKTRAACFAQRIPSHDSRRRANCAIFATILPQPGTCLKIVLASRTILTYCFGRRASLFPVFSCVTRLASTS